MSATTTSLDSASMGTIVSDTMRIKSLKMLTVKFLNVLQDIPENADTSQNSIFASLAPTASTLTKKKYRYEINWVDWERVGWGKETNKWKRQWNKKTFLFRYLA